MEIVKQYPTAFAIASILLLATEQILPHLPIKADSTAQVIINVAKAILGKRDK